MTDHNVPQFDAATPLHPEISKRYRRRDRVEKLVKARHNDGGIAADTELASIYAPVKEQGVEDPVVIEVKKPDGNRLAWWADVRDIERLVSKLLLNDYVVTYFEEDHVHVDGDGVEIDRAYDPEDE